MEPVGLSLSIIALFSECLKAYRVFSTANCLSSDLNILKTKFQIEETRLTQWGLYWGYKPEASECTLDATVEEAGQNVVSTVKLTLLQVSTLLKEYDAVSVKYEGGGHSAAYRGMIWALKDKSKLESIIKNLNDFNNALHQLLPRAKDLSLTQASACAIISSSNADDDLENVIAAMASLRNTDAVKLARLKKAYQMLTSEDEKELVQSSAMVCSTLEVDFGRFKLSSRYSSDERTLGSFDGNARVMIEWKSYHAGMFSGSATMRSVLRNRASHLAELMSARSPRPAGLNILTCVGYFDQVSLGRYGFAYEIPPTVVQHMPLTLHELLTPSNMPDLGTRFRMALSLATTVNLLHSSGWLHKSIRSSNVVLFQTVKANTPEFDTPYLVGFRYSRPDGYDEETFHEQSATELTNQLYRHPEVQGPNPRRYRASDDIYSLGLVLLEIALWKPITSLGERTRMNSRELLNMDKIMAAVASLGRKVGSIYQVAVEKCIHGNPTTLPQLPLSQSAAEWSAERLRKQNQVYWDVVKALEDCKA